MSERKVMYTTCKSCHGGCGVKVTVEDNAIVHIEGREDSLTRGTMCAKGLSSIQHIDNPYRLKHPVKQVGPKGKGNWERISWDEALDTIEKKIKEAQAKYGPESIATSQGTGRGYNRYTHRFARSIGSANVISPGYVCHSPRLGLYGLVTGYGRLYCDYHGWGGVFPKTQIMWAKQLEISSADSEMCNWFIQSLDYCKNLIIIDPRASAYATRATLWLQPRPGSDCALAMGMMNVIFKEELWDKEFVENWTYGFEELRERVAPFTPEKTEEITWVPKEKIIEAARMFAIDTPGCIQVGSSLERQANCGHTLRAITNLMGMTGNIEAPGSMVSWVLPDTGLIEDFFLELPLTEEMKSKIIGIDKFKMGAARTCNPDTMVKAIISGKAPIQVWFSVGGQQIVHMANTKEVVKAIEKVPFMVHVDLFMGPMAEAADIVLPAAHWLELNDVYDMHPRFMIEAHNKVLDPPGEAQSDAWIFNEIGKRVAPEHWFDSEEELLDHQVKKGSDGKMTWKEFSEKLVSGCWGDDQVYYKYKTDYWREGGGFPTPTGKFEFKSKHLESLGYDGLPVFREPGESPYSTPELYKEYPLVMSSGFRQPFYFLAQYRNIPWLRSFMEYPICQLHPETAEKYNVKDGDWIWIESPRGRIRQRARVFPGILKGMLMTTGNWFYPEEPAEGYHGVYISNPNVLTSNDHLDPMYGSPDLTCLLCKVYPCKPEELTEDVFKQDEFGFINEAATNDEETIANPFRNRE
ncbi:MAG: molybdopterin-dependent oxidoreductase [Proteobacteria bacterium]|nr:molybdopterin-dependent oxidoreductase [Pseudomonadota bacterium]